MKRVVVAFVSLLALLGCSRTHSSESSISSLISSYSDSSLSESQSERYTYRENGIPVNGMTTEYFANDYIACRIFRSSSDLTDEQNTFVRFKSVNEVKEYVDHLKEAKDPYYGAFYYQVMINYLESLDEEAFADKDLVISQGITHYSMGITDYLINVELKDEKIFCYLDRYIPGNHGYSADCAMAYECLVIFINKDLVFNQIEIVVTEV